MKSFTFINYLNKELDKLSDEERLKAFNEYNKGLRGINHFKDKRNTFNNKQD
jgi:uncharacterized membrane protein